MRRDLFLILAVVMALAMVGVVITELWNNGSGQRRMADRPLRGPSDSDESHPLLRRSGNGDDATELRPPEIRLIADRDEYIAWYREHRQDRDVDAPSPEGIDFNAFQVVVVLWGDKPGLGHRMEVTGVEKRERETVVTIRTHAPEIVDDPAMVFPGLAVPTPLNRPVRVRITGERMRPAPRFVDFQAFRGQGLEVEVMPHEPIRDRF